MNPVRLALRVAVLGVLGVLAVGSLGFAASEADWFYEAAALQKRFETISAAQIPYAQKTEDYYKLLDDVTKFGAMAGESERATRGRKAFSLLATGWIQQMLANTEAANKATADYNKSLEAMPEDERAVVQSFFEKNYQKTAPLMPRVCNVEAGDFAVRVTAVDWPIRDLLQRMADAAGVRIEIPKEVSGVVDYQTDNWESVDRAISSLAVSKGLAMMDRLGRDAIAPLRVRIGDPLYMASIGERADKRAGLPGLEKPPEGIQTGYVLLRGHYVPPPYLVDAREKDQALHVCINGIPVDEGRSLVPPVMRGHVPPLGEAKTIGDIMGSAGWEFAALKAKYGVQEAVRQLQKELDNHPMLASAKVAADGAGAVITMKDGLRGSIGLHAYSSARTPTDFAAKLTDGRSANTRMASEQVAELQAVLAQNGLLIVSGTSKGGVVEYNSKEGYKRLADVCIMMQEVERCRQALSLALFAEDWPRGVYGTTWEVMLNLRHRELLDDMHRRPQYP